MSLVVGSTRWRLLAMGTSMPGMWFWCNLLTVIRGLGEHGQLGIAEAATNQLVPVLVSSLAVNKAIAVVSGWWHSMAITKIKAEGEDGEKDGEKGDGKGKDGEKNLFNLSKSTTGMVADREFDRVCRVMIRDSHDLLGTARYGAQNTGYSFEEKAKDIQRLRRISSYRRLRRNKFFRRSRASVSAELQKILRIRSAHKWG